MIQLGSGETIQFSLETYGTISPLPSPLITYPEVYPYYPAKPAKYPHRQKRPHVHGLNSTSDGKQVYICDLGSDATWVARRDSEGIKVIGRLERERGDTPRHCLLSPDGQSHCGIKVGDVDIVEKYLYVISELQSQLLIYSTSTHRLLSRIDVTPPNLPPYGKEQLLVAELYIHPTHRRTLYVSNRGALRVREPDGSKAHYGIKGDSISIVLLNEQGSGVEETKWVETGLDWIRGMRISDDGKWLACAGEYGGGIEIYEISGERGELMNLRARNEGIKDVNCVLWL